jgi:hypothetical protein
MQQRDLVNELPLLSDNSQLTYPPHLKVTYLIYPSWKMRRWVT